MFYSPPRINNYRPDIDGLRAIAILTVVFFHTFPEFCPGGFIGVDIIFVISGFLISGIIFKKLEKENFSFTDFYFRRIRRIFPALIFLLIGITIAGCILLAPPELRLLVRQICWGAFFGENIYLIKSTGGYWDQATEMMPLMHLWTLAVEEQFYIFYPLICVILFKIKKLVSALVILTLLSFFSVYFFKDNTILNFYSLHTRFWELACGGLLAFYINKNNFLSTLSLAKQNLSSFSGILLVTIGLVITNEQDKFPGIITLFPVLGTLLILIGQNSIFNKSILSHRLVVFVGLISYTWYLWHWPPLAFSRIILGGDIPGFGARIILIFVGLLIAIISYFFVENPIRKMKATLRLSISLSVILFFVFASGTTIRLMKGLPQRLDKAQQLVLESADNNFPHTTDYCLEKYGKGSLDAYSFCYAEKGKTAEIAILGDSHGRHLLRGLFAGTSKGIVFLGMKGTPAIKNVFEVTAEPNYIKKGQGQSMLDKAFDKILNDPKIKTVILASRWNLFLNSPGLYSWLNDNRVEPNDYTKREEALKLFMTDWLKQLQTHKKNVMIILNTPEFPFTVYSCYRPIFSLDKCGVSQKEATAATSKVNEIIKGISSKFTNVEVIDPTNIVCKNGYCSLVNNGKAVYRDENHLTSYGSTLIAPAILEKLKD